MLIAAHLRKQIRVGRQRDAHQLARVLAVELQLEDTAHGHFGFSLGILTREPKQFGDAVAQWPDQGQPAVEFRRAYIGRAVEPIGIIRQVEVTGSAGDGAAMLDRKSVV